MIIVAGTVEFDLAQPGCLDYVWCADPSSESRIYVYERWRDTPTFAAHLAGPCYRGMLEVLARNGLRSANVAKHRIDKSEPIYDAHGKPRADFFTT